ncbi:MAG: hypothetical protein MHPSP_004282, partial [Paramarteilia canceri]
QALNYSRSKAYLKERNKLSPKEKYNVPQLSSWSYGWIGNLRNKIEQNHNTTTALTNINENNKTFYGRINHISR